MSSLLPSLPPDAFFDLEELLSSDIRFISLQRAKKFKFVESEVSISERKTQSHGKNLKALPGE